MRMTALCADAGILAPQNNDRRWVMITCTVCSRWRAPIGSLRKIELKRRGGPCAA
jgi:hypothetical protein